MKYNENTDKAKSNHQKERDLHMKELYTVEDIADMFHLTTRTIRNYLRDGRLKGSKLGGQWRFTEENVKMLLTDAEVNKAMEDKPRQDVLDFLDGVNTDLKGPMQICSIVDLYVAPQEAERKSRALCELINGAGEVGFLRFYFNYIEAEDKARYILFASPEMICSAMELLKA